MMNHVNGSAISKRHVKLVLEMVKFGSIGLGWYVSWIAQWDHNFRSESGSTESSYHRENGITMSFRGTWDESFLRWEYKSWCNMQKNIGFGFGFGFGEKWSGVSTWLKWSVSALVLNSDTLLTALMANTDDRPRHRYAPSSTLLCFSFYKQPTNQNLLHITRDGKLCFWIWALQ